MASAWHGVCLSLQEQRPWPHGWEHHDPFTSRSFKMQRSDSTLISQIATGDVEAFECLYQRYAPRLTGYLVRHLVSPGLVDEVINDVMLVVWQRAACFQPTSSVSTWIFGIARNKAYKAVHRNRPQSPLPFPPEAEGHDGNPEQTLQQRERDHELAQALRRLSAEHRTVVEWTYHHGLPAQEVAQRLGISANTVRSRLKLARRRLATLLARGVCRVHVADRGHMA
jgi:RNA polymerase sigma factor (sigma-70 family)